MRECYNLCHESNSRTPIILNYFSIFSELDRPLNRKSYRFMVHWSDRRSNRGRTDDVINIYFIILYITKN